MAAVSLVLAAKWNEPKVAPSTFQPPSPNPNPDPDPNPNPDPHQVAPTSFQPPNPNPNPSTSPNPNPNPDPNQGGCSDCRSPSPRTSSSRRRRTRRRAPCATSSRGTTPATCCASCCRSSPASRHAPCGGGCRWRCCCSPLPSTRYRRGKPLHHSPYCRRDRVQYCTIYFASD